MCNLSELKRELKSEIAVHVLRSWLSWITKCFNGSCDWRDMAMAPPLGRKVPGTFFESFWSIPWPESELKLQNTLAAFRDQSSGIQKIWHHFKFAIWCANCNSTWPKSARTGYPYLISAFNWHFVSACLLSGNNLNLMGGSNLQSYHLAISKTLAVLLCVKLLSQKVLSISKKSNAKQFANIQWLCGKLQGRCSC